MKSRLFSIAALTLLICLNAFALLRWVRADTRPLAWDESIHTQNTLEYRDRLGRGSFLDVMNPVYFNYPPLYNLSVIPFLDLVPDIADAGAAANVFYLSLLVIACYLIGAALMDRLAGLAAATLVGFYPMIAHLARFTMLDLALTFWVAAAFYTLIKSEQLSRVGWSGAFGALLGLGMLTKWTALAYLVGPLLAVGWVCLRRRTFAGAAVAAVVFVAVILPWYGLNTIPMLARVMQVSGHHPAAGMEFTGWQKALWYPIALFEQLNLPFLILFLIGLAFSFWKKELRPVLLWFFVSMILFSLIRNNNVRYLLPALPAAAVLSASWVAGRQWALGVVMAVAAVFFVAFNFSSAPIVAANVRDIPLTFFNRLGPIAEDWHHRDIIRRIDEVRDHSAAYSRVVVLSNMPYFHSTTLNITARGLGVERFSFRGPSKSDRWMDFAAFILVKTGNLGPPETINTIQHKIDELAAAPAWFAKSYKEVGRWPMPDGADSILYQAAPDPQPVSKDELVNVTLGEVRLPNVLARGVDIRAEAMTPRDTSLGRLARLTVKARSVEFKGVPVEEVTLVLLRPQINLPRYKQSGELQILALDRLSIRATVSAATVLSYAAAKVKWLKDPDLAFDQETIVASGKANGRVPLRLEASLHVDGDVLRPRLESVRVWGVSIPVIFVRALTDRSVPLAPNSESPFQIDLGRIRGEGKLLKVGAP